MFFLSQIILIKFKITILVMWVSKFLRVVKIYFLFCFSGGAGRAVAKVLDFGSNLLGIESRLKTIFIIVKNAGRALIPEEGNRKPCENFSTITMYIEDILDRNRRHSESSMALEEEEILFEISFFFISVYFCIVTF